MNKGFGTEMKATLEVQKKGENHDWLVGGLEHFIFFHILGRIIPTD